MISLNISIEIYGNPWEPTGTHIWYFNDPTETGDELFVILGPSKFDFLTDSAKVNELSVILVICEVSKIDFPTPQTTWRLSRPQLKVIDMLHLGNWG